MFGLDSPRIEHFVYLLIVLLVVGALSLPLRRIGIGKLAGYALAWAAIFGVGALALGETPWGKREAARGELARMAEPDPPQVEALSGPGGGELRVPASRDGHFWVTAQINGKPVRFLVDTGASEVVLSARTAQRVGIDMSRLRYNRPGIAANGPVRAADARVERMTIGPIARTNMPVSVFQSSVDINLLGMRFLRSLDGWRVEKGTLILTA